MQDFRVIDLPERTTLDSSDYVMIDSAENGTNKYLLSRQAAETDTKIATAVGGVEEELNAAVEGIEESLTDLSESVGDLKSSFDYLADDVNNISGSILIQPLEIGWAYISNGQIAYSSSANATRLKKGYYLRLNQGDVIYNDSPSNYDFRGGYSTDGGSTWNDISWQSTASYNVSVTGLYIFTFRDKNATISDIERHMSHYKIIRGSSTLLQIESCLINENGSWED